MGAGVAGVILAAGLTFAALSLGKKKNSRESSSFDIINFILCLKTALFCWKFFVGCSLHF